jgi:hypothetical protein
MTIHSNVTSNANTLAGHAWVEFKGDNGTTQTLSLWGNQGSREFFADKEKGKSGVVSRTVDITTGDIKKINNFNSDSENVDWNAGNTCAGYCVNVWNDVTGENLDATNALGITNPATLSGSIVDANGGKNNNTGTTGNTTESSDSSTNSGSSTSSSSSASSTNSSLSAGSSGGAGEKDKKELQKYTDTELK